MLNICMTRPGFAIVEGKRYRAFFFEDGSISDIYDEETKSYINYGIFIRKRKRENNFRFIRHATDGEIEKTNLEVLFTDKEKRVICGKPRTCKLSGGKIVEVYDEDKKVYVPHDEFLRQQEEYKTNPIVDDTKEGYYSTRGKRERVKVKEDKKLDDDIKNKLSTLTTDTSTFVGSSGTYPVDISISGSPEISVDVKTTTKAKIKDPYDWYIKKVLKY